MSKQENIVIPHYGIKYTSINGAAKTKNCFQNKLDLYKYKRNQIKHIAEY